MWPQALGAASLAAAEVDPTPAPTLTPAPAPTQTAAPQDKAKPAAQPKPKPAPQPKPKANEPRELKHDDGKSAGMKSIAGGGHGVNFESPGEGWKLTAIRLYGSRYGYPQAAE